MFGKTYTCEGKERSEGFSNRLGIAFLTASWGRRSGVLLCAAICLLSPGSAWAHFEPVTCKNSFTVPQEIAEGNKVAAQVYAQMPVLPPNDPLTIYVQGLGAKLVSQAPPSPGTNERWPYNFHVVASEEINAFALPGGSVFVNLGTIQAAQTEAQLAGVMAHEISHVVMRHSTCNLSKQRSRSLLYGLGAIGSAILLGNTAAGQLAQTGIGLGQSLDFLHMSRDDERQADLLGTNILYDVGYDPRGLPQFFETIQAKYGQGGAQMLSDHPNPGNRTEYVNAEIATLPRRPGATVTSAAFTRMHDGAMKQHALTSKEVQAGGWKREGRYAAGPAGGVLNVSGGTSAPAAASPAASAPALPPLRSADLVIGDALVPLQSRRFFVKYPPKWQHTEDQNGIVILAPPGGSSAAGLAYGAVIGTQKVSGDGVREAASLTHATSELIRNLAAENGLQQTGDVASIKLGNQMAATAELRGRSPVAGGDGAPAAEHDWLVTVARPDGDLNYLIFVAPEADFATLKPTFRGMAASFQAQ